MNPTVCPVQSHILIIDYLVSVSSSGEVVQMLLSTTQGAHERIPVSGALLCLFVCFEGLVHRHRHRKRLSILEDQMEAKEKKTYLSMGKL